LGNDAYAFILQTADWMHQCKVSNAARWLGGIVAALWRHGGIVGALAAWRHCLAAWRHCGGMAAWLAAYYASWRHCGGIVAAHNASSGIVGGMAAWRHCLAA
jgi:hypothetical protein